MMRRAAALAILASLALVPSAGLEAQSAAESRNMVLVAHHDLNGNGDGGEGLALQQFPGGRKILYLAHEAPARCVSVLDVTKPEAPVLLNQLPSPAPGVTRCNSLGLSGAVLAVANQSAKQPACGCSTSRASSASRRRSRSTT